MNKGMIRFILGWIFIIQSVLLLLPCIFAIIYAEQQGIYYAGTALVSFVIGILLSRKKPSDNVFYLKEGCIITALSWIILSFFGAMPLWLSKEIPDFTDAVFEIASGYTTTGSTICPSVEALSHAANFWRCFTHWVGGMGVLVFLIAIVPMSGGSNINLMRAESPGPSVGKLVPKIRQTARILYAIYFGLTIAEFIFLVCGQMPIFDAICSSVGTAGTGGFGIKNDSFASYSDYCQIVVTVFMILFGVNFNAYYFIIYKQFKKAFSMEEVKWYFIIIFTSIAIITINILNQVGNLFVAIKDASFQVGAIITTTGFASADFDTWPILSKTILVMLMFVGACAGSTGGGIKVSRFIISIKSVKKELQSYLHPKLIKKIKMDGHPIEHDIIRATNVYFMTYILIFIISLLVISLEGKSLVTNFTAICATLNNIGPGLEAVGPTQNFADYGILSKWIMIFDMLAGRLELFPMLMLFHPGIWKDFFKKKARRQISQ